MTRLFLALFMLAVVLPASAQDREAATPDRATSERATPFAPLQAKPALRLQVRERTKTFESDLAAPGSGPQEWKCTEYDSGAVSCECKGMLDCKKLIDSGKCEGKSWWEATDDPSIGGCDGSS